MQDFIDSYIIPEGGKSLALVLWVEFNKEGKALGGQFYVVVSEPSAFKAISAFSLSYEADHMLLHIVGRDIDRTKLATGRLAGIAGLGWGPAALTAKHLPSPSQ